MPKLYIIAGPNGAGKTTASFTVLPEMLECREFINADEIARGLSPFNVEAAAMQAGRIMLERINRFLKEGIDFSIETTLATKTYRSLIARAQQMGYEVSLIYFWLESPEMAMDRVERRVVRGGHNIPDGIVKRRYQKGIELLVNSFINLVDYWWIYDNSDGVQEIVANGFFGKNPEIYNVEKWKRLKTIASDNR